jgi:hypothetical protein
MTEQSFVLYTYQQIPDSGAEGGFRLDCHAYGPTSEASAQVIGQNLEQSASSANEKPLGFMVLLIEALSTQHPTPSSASWVVYRGEQVFQAAPQYHAYLTSDPAAGDALGTAWQAAGQASNFMVLPLEATPA